MIPIVEFEERSKTGPFMDKADFDNLVMEMAMEVVEEQFIVPAAAVRQHLRPPDRQAQARVRGRRPALDRRAARVRRARVRAAHRGLSCLLHADLGELGRLAPLSMRAVP